MEINKVIAHYLGTAAATYAAHKQRGGSNGRKGSRYEDWFMAYKVIQSCHAALHQGAMDALHVSSQVEGFVDDLRLASSNSTDYYQLKNKQEVSWHAGAHPLQQDFCWQYQLACLLQEAAPKTHLVVADQALQQQLQQDMPEAIQAHTAVHFFPWCDCVQALLQQDLQLRAWLGELANTPHATQDVLLGVFYCLMNACLEHPAGASLDILLQTAGQLHPGQLRLLPLDEDWQAFIGAECAGILSQIPGLVYGAERGYFYWSWQNGLQQGIFPFSVRHPSFLRFQQSVIQSSPTTFDDFEKVLP